MNILAIETSCDETSVAILRDGRHVLANVIASQIDLHRRYGGVVPELASRQHIVTIVPVLEEALRLAGVGWDDVDAIAVTCGPGLAGALLVGLNAAKAIAFALDKPLVAVNHLEAHIYSNWVLPEGLEQHGPAQGPEEQVLAPRPARAADALRAAGYDPSRKKVPPPPVAPPARSRLPDLKRAEPTDPVFPLLALVVSGGHTELVYVSGHGQYTLLGRTVDDAAGEAFDKVARILRLGYPGGPEIQRVAAHGNPGAIDLPRRVMRGTYDFSFSGLKTAVLHKVQEYGPPAEPPAALVEEKAPEVDPVAEQAVAEQPGALDRNRRARQETGELQPAGERAGSRGQRADERAEASGQRAGDGGGSREPRAESREPKAESQEPKAESREPKADEGESKSGGAAAAREWRDRLLADEDRAGAAAGAPPGTAKRRPGGREQGEQSEERRVEEREPRVLGGVAAPGQPRVAAGEAAAAPLAAHVAGREAADAAAPASGPVPAPGEELEREEPRGAAASAQGAGSGRPEAAPAEADRTPPAGDDSPAGEAAQGEGDEPELPGLIRLPPQSIAEGQDENPLARRSFDLRRDADLPIESRADPSAPRVLGRDEQPRVAPPPFLAARGGGTPPTELPRRGATPQPDLPGFLRPRAGAGDTPAEDAEAGAPAPPAAPVPVRPAQSHGHAEDRRPAPGRPAPAWAGEEVAGTPRVAASPAGGEARRESPHRPVEPAAGDDRPDGGRPERADDPRRAEQAEEPGGRSNVSRLEEPGSASREAPRAAPEPQPFRPRPPSTSQRPPYTRAPERRPPAEPDPRHRQPPAREPDEPPGRPGSAPRSADPAGPRREPSAPGSSATPPARPSAPRPPYQPLRPVPKAVQAGRVKPEDAGEDLDRNLADLLDDEGGQDEQEQDTPRRTLWPADPDDDGGGDDPSPGRRGTIALEGPRRPPASSRVPGKAVDAAGKPPLPVADVAAAFQAAAVEILVEKVAMAAAAYEVHTVLIAGGVAANKLLRSRMQERLGDEIAVRYPPPVLCTDNAAMVAAAAYFRYEAGLQRDWSLDIDPNAGYLSD